MPEQVVECIVSALDISSPSCRRFFANLQIFLCDLADIAARRVYKLRAPRFHDLAHQQISLRHHGAVHAAAANLLA
jgi:hypothetical protein